MSIMYVPTIFTARVKRVAKTYIVWIFFFRFPKTLLNTIIDFIDR